MRPKNTKQEGFMEFLVYKEDDRFIGVCLTFDIVEEGYDPITLMKSIEEASTLHLEIVIKENMSDELLNRYAPDEYWVKYFAVLAHSQKLNKPTSYFRRSPYHQTQAVAVA